MPDGLKYNKIKIIKFIILNQKTAKKLFFLIKLKEKTVIQEKNTKPH